ncbi:hypothetical protein NEOLEDRAFT_1094376 [Neolentinus lepideus HHB14362 ss-1]|uniref:Uncharacterized protein n=1 Tax=Neolentinus lepideus HHB14362 ss-1 TaxID=1314782 RepID=A0A165S1W0_9AGAM|nr:hypothetical protein NEOLEDRAFT_1094376 [Neolentinus lepideus HHB14362 ss-1]
MRVSLRLMRRKLFYPASLLLLLHRSHVAWATLTNRTIDDQYGDEVSGLVPGYSPAASWAQGSTCTGCFIHADPSQAYRGTWHDSTHTPGDAEPRVIYISFNGTAIYAYCILANYVQYTTTLTNLTFRLDGNGVGENYVHVPTTSTSFQYNVPVYVNDSIPNGQHTLEIEATGDTNSSLVLFDYATYTYDSDPVSSSTSASATSSPSPTNSQISSPKHSSNVGAIAGGVVGGVAFLAAILLGAFLYSRRRRSGVHEIGGPRRRRNKVDLTDSDDDPSLAGPEMTANPFRPHDLNGASSSNVAILEPFLPAESTSTRIPDSEYGYGVGTGRDNPPVQAAVVPPAAVSGVGDSSRPHPRSKAAMRQEELSRQIREREQHVADLQRRRTFTSHSVSVPQSTSPPSSVDPPSSTSSRGDVDLRNQIEALQQEVERLRTEQRHMLWEMEDAPPPEYQERPMGE